MTVSDRPLPIVNDASSGSLKEHLEAALRTGTMNHWTTRRCRSESGPTGNAVSTF